MRRRRRKQYSYRSAAQYFQRLNPWGKCSNRVSSSRAEIERKHAGRRGICVKCGIRPVPGLKYWSDIALASAALHSFVDVFVGQMYYVSNYFDGSGLRVLLVTLLLLFLSDHLQALAVEGLTHHSLSSIDDVQTLMMKLRRAQQQLSATTHAVTTMALTFPGSATSPSSSSSRIHVVELASSDLHRRNSNGDDSSGRSDNDAAAAAVHRSLQTVGRVLCALAKGAEACAQLHVPFQDTALTSLLKRSLCHGQGTCALLATVKPNEEHYEKTLATLR